MTTTLGERIAQKRKELGLSQEGLGERLGVSRQAIYKWESGATLPEIEKLIAMSKVFSVSVGWLLGVEEADDPAPGEGQDSGELTEAQLAMVEEIVGRYLAAQPAPQKAKRRRWPWVLAALALIAVGFELFNRLELLSDRYSALQNTVAVLNSTVSSQIGSITDRVEEILQSQNDLTASYSCQITTTDLANNTVSFDVAATPKEYAPDMTAQFTAQVDGGTVVTAAGVLDPATNTFSASLDCPLADDIVISVVFQTGDLLRTQVIEGYTDLYTGSFPYVSAMDTLWGSVDRGILRNDHLWLRASELEHDLKGGTVQITDLQVGLFCDQILVTWYTPVEKPPNFVGFEEDTLFFYREQPVKVEEGKIYTEALLITDQHGRQWVQTCGQFAYDSEEDFMNHTDSGDDLSMDPSDWSF